MESLCLEGAEKQDEYFSEEEIKEICCKHEKGDAECEECVRFYLWILSITEADAENVEGRERLAKFLRRKGDLQALKNLYLTYIPQECLITNLHINSILKGLLFEQDIYEHCSIDHFVIEHKEKYGFLLDRGSDDDEKVFQGSTAEGLAIFTILELDENEQDYRTKWKRRFDYDMMFIKQLTVMDPEDAFREFIKDEKSFEEGEEKWKNSVSCKHDEEPLVVMNAYDKRNDQTPLIEHILVAQPACAVCVSEKPPGDQWTGKATTEYRGRTMLIRGPGRFFIDFKEDCFKREKYESDFNGREFAHSCQMLNCFGEDFNRNGSLCFKCRPLNQTILKHENEASTHIFLDSVVNAGPSVKLRFCMTHEGDRVEGLPLFNESGVSLVECDNVPALNYPLLDWSHLTEELRKSVSKDTQRFRWPSQCKEFLQRNPKSGWPSSQLKYQILLEGCQIVPRLPRAMGEKGPSTWMRYVFANIVSEPYWRISFSVSEKLLTKSFNLPQRRCFLILKIMFKCICKKMNIELEEKYANVVKETKKHLKLIKVSSFLLKHVMFWTLEEVDEDDWRMNNIYQCMIHVFDKMDTLLKNESIPHYFLKGKNLLAGDIVSRNEENAKMALTDECRIIRQAMDLMRDPGNMIYLLRDIMFFVTGTRTERQDERESILDFNWDWESSLYSAPLLNSFSKLIIHSVENKDDEEFKRKMIEHHTVMINLIRNSPRKYGSGVNTELLNLLIEEVSLLEQNNSSILNLDSAEKQTMLAKKEKPKND